jgi:hypothetical protein
VAPGATCVTTSSLVSQVGAWLGASHLDATLTVAVSGSSSDPRDVAFEVQRGSKPLAQRRFNPAPFVCAQLEATLALAIAMALKVSLRDELLDTLGGKNQASEQPTSIAGLVRAGYSLLPGLSLGVGLAGTQALGAHFALRAEAERAPGSFDSWLLSGQVLGCALFPLSGAWSARVCLGIAFGGLHVRGHGYRQSHTAWLPWVAVSNSVGLSVELSRHWGLDMPVGVVVPLNQLTVGVERSDGSAEDVRTLPRVGFTAALGPQYHF